MGLLLSHGSGLLLVLLGQNISGFTEEINSRFNFGKGLSNVSHWIFYLKSFEDLFDLIGELVDSLPGDVLVHLLEDLVQRFDFCLGLLLVDRVLVLVLIVVVLPHLDLVSQLFVRIVHLLLQTKLQVLICLLLGQFRPRLSSRRATSRHIKTVPLEHELLGSLDLLHISSEHIDFIELLLDV